MGKETIESLLTFDLIKEVEDTAGNNVNNQTLALGQELFYTLTFQNTGNDNAVNFTITDVFDPCDSFHSSNLIFLTASYIIELQSKYRFDAFICVLFENPYFFIMDA